METEQTAVSHFSCKYSRNQSIECCKMLSAVLVVFLHMNFPGRIGTYISCLGCCAVPLFFAITGYFNYKADCAALVRRLKHNLRLYLIAISVNLIYGICATEYLGGSTAAYLIQFIPKPDELARWFVFHASPRLRQLWYITAVCTCYFFLWLYVRFWGKSPVDYRPLYLIGAGLFPIFLAFGVLAPPLKMAVPYHLYLNGFFMGLPFFIFGIFLHQYQDRILSNFNLTKRKLVSLALLGVLLSILQGVSMGMGQVTLGGIIQIAALMMLMILYPTITYASGVLRTCITKFSSWSTYMYLFHITVISFYTQFLEMPITTAFPKQQAYLHPLIVLALSFLAAVIAERVEWLLKQIRKK